MLINTYFFDHGIYQFPSNISFDLLIDKFNNYKENTIDFITIKSYINKFVKEFDEKDISILFNTCYILFTDEIDYSEYFLPIESKKINSDYWKFYIFLQSFKSKKEINRQNTKIISKDQDKRLNDTISYIRETDIFRDKASQHNLCPELFIREYWDYIVNNYLLNNSLFHKALEKVINETPKNLRLPFNIGTDPCVKIKKLYNSFYIKSYKKRVHNLIITNCVNSNIFIEGEIDYVYINLCENCNIFISGIKKIITINKNNKVKVTCACFYIKISNNLETNISIYSINEPIILGDNRYITIGPYNTNYKNLEKYCKLNNIIISENYIDKFSYPQYFYENMIIFKNKNKEKSSIYGYSIISPNNFTVLVLPNSIGYLNFDDILCKNNELFILNKKIIEDNNDFLNKNSKYISFLVPHKYIMHLLNRFNNISLIYKQLETNKMSKNDFEIFKTILENKFKDWYFKNNDHKQIISIIKLLENSNN